MIVDRRSIPSRVRRWVEAWVILPVRFPVPVLAGARGVRRRQGMLGWAFRCGAAAAAVAVGVGVRLVIDRVGPGLPTYITFYPAIMVAALVAGAGPGLLATALSALAAAYWFLPPAGFRVASLVDRLGVVIFVGMGVFMSVVAGLYRRSMAKAAAYDRERVLNESRERLAAFAEATFEGIVHSQAGRITDCNEQFSRMVGASVSELKGTRMADLMVPEDRERIMANVMARKEATVEFGLLRRDGTRVFVEAHGRPMFPGGERRHTAVRDITERKRAEEVLKRDKDAFERLVEKRTGELVQARLELERSKRLSDIGALAATVAHELRNPLATIRMAAHNIRRKAPDSSLDGHVATIDKKVGESEQIINNLLFYSRLRPPHYEKVNLFEIIEECLEAMEGKHRKNISVSKNIEPLKTLYVEADPVQMKEVFNNLLDNAHDAVAAGEGRIRVVGERDGGFVRVAVEDNGTGIAADDLAKVFDPFFTTKAKGTGLGLSVCKQIVVLHKGEIEIKSDCGRGTSVSVRLPHQSAVS